MHWSYIVVLQENEQKNGKGSNKNDIIREYYLEFGMHILMGNECIFNITCDFSNSTKTLEKFGLNFAFNLVYLI